MPTPVSASAFAPATAPRALPRTPRGLALACLTVWALAGCATAPMAPLQVPGLERSQALQVLDVRPAEEREHKIFSLLITTDDYGIVRTGEQGVEPSPVRLLQHRAFEQVGPTAQIRVHHLVSYLNRQAQHRAAAAGAVLAGGLGGAITAQAAEQTVPTAVTRLTADDFARMSASQEWRRGAYSEAENPKKGAVYIVYLDAELNGQRALVRAISPVQVPPGERPYFKALDAAIGGWLQAVRGAASVAVPSAGSLPSQASPAGGSEPDAAHNPPPGSPATLLGGPALERLADGHAWSYPHPRDPERFGQVRISMSRGQLHARNDRSRTDGSYTVIGDQLCANFQAPGWGTVCYQVLETVNAAGGITRELVTLPSGRKAPLVVD